MNILPSAMPCAMCGSNETLGNLVLKENLVCYVPKGGKISDDPSLKHGVPGWLNDRDGDGTYYKAVQDVILISCSFCGYSWTCAPILQEGRSP